MNHADDAEYFVPSQWSARALTIARGSAVAAVAAISFSTALTSIFCALMLVSWISSGRAWSTLLDSLRQPIGVALAIFLGVVALGMLHGPVGIGDRFEALWGWRKLFYAVILLGLFAEERWKYYFVIAFLSIACIGFGLSYISWLEWVSVYRWSDPGIVFQNHSTQGMVFALAVLCCHQLISNVSRRFRFYLLLFGVLFALNVVFISSGRSGYLALAVVGAIIGISRFGYRRLPLLAVAAAGAVAIAILISPVLKERVNLAVHEVTNFEPTLGLTSIGFRLVTYENSAELIAEKPLLGYGTGSFGTVYSAHVAGKYSDWRAKGTTDPHNQYLFIWVENGMIGVLAFLGFLVLAFRTRGVPTAYSTIGLGALAIWTLTSAFNSHFRTFPEGHLIGLFLGAMLAGGNLTRPTGKLRTDIT